MMKKYGLKIGTHDFWRGDVNRFEHWTPVGWWIVRKFYRINYYPACGAAHVRPQKWCVDWGLMR